MSKNTLKTDNLSVRRWSVVAFWLLLLPSASLAWAAQIALEQFVCEPSPAVAGQDFRLVFQWNQIPNSARFRLFDPTGSLKMDRTLEQPSEIKFAASVYMRHLTARGIYRLEVTASKTGLSSMQRVVEFQLVDKPYSRSDREAKLRIVRVSPSKAHAGEDVKVTIQSEPSGLEVRYSVRRPTSSGALIVGQSRDKEFTFNTSEARGSLNESGRYVLRAGANTPDGGYLSDERPFQFVNHPPMALGYLFPTENLIAVAPGGKNEFLVEVRNLGQAEFRGSLKVTGDPQFYFFVEGGTSEKQTALTELRVAPKQRKAVRVVIEPPARYSRGQAEDIWARMRSVLGTGFSSQSRSLPDVATDDEIVVRLEGADGEFIDRLEYGVKSAGGKRAGHLKVFVQIDPNILGELRSLPPRSSHKARFNIVNDGSTLMFVRDLAVSWPTCVRPLSGGQIISLPNPWKTAKPVQMAMVDLLSAMADPSRVATGPLVRSMADLHMTKYFAAFLELSKIGVPLPVGEKLVLEVPLQSLDEGSGSIGFSVGYSDYGSNPPYDFGTGYSGAASAVAQWERDILTKGYTPVGLRAEAQAQIEVGPQAFGKEIDDIVAPLANAGQALTESFRQAVGFFAGIHSPADLHVYDSQGRHVGMNYALDTYENEIPGAQHISAQDANYVFVPGSIGNFKVATKGRRAGSYDLDVIRPVVVQAEDSVLHRVLLPVRYSRISTAAGMEQIHCPDVVAVGKQASRLLRQRSVESALKEALAVVSAQNAMPTAKHDWEWILLVGSLLVAVVAFLALMIRRRKARVNTETLERP